MKIAQCCRKDSIWIQTIGHYSTYYRGLIANHFLSHFTHTPLMKYLIQNFVKIAQCFRLHGIDNLPIPALVPQIYHIDVQSCGRGMGRSSYLNVGEVFYKTLNYNWANFQNNIFLHWFKNKLRSLKTTKSCDFCDCQNRRIFL